MKNTWKMLSSVAVCGLVFMACSEDDPVAVETPGTGGFNFNTGGYVAAGGFMAAGGLVTTGGASTGGASGGTGGSLGGMGGEGSACMPDYPASIGVTARDDTNTWGENDFDSVTLIEDTCGATITAVLPHETGWEDADPSESNMESTHFALEFPYSANADLTGKQLNLSLKLLEDGRGPLAENGGYAVYLGVVEGETGGWTEGATPWADGMENMPGYSGALYNPGDTVNLSYVVPADDADLDDADIYKLFVRIETKYWGDGTDPVFDYSTAVFELMQLTVTDAL